MKFSAPWHLVGYFAVYDAKDLLVTDTSFTGGSPRINGENAKLIAAGPELAAALQALLGEAEAWGVKMDAFRPARAALAKAGL